MTYSLTWKACRLPLRTPLRTAHGPWAEREGLLVRLEGAAGRVGYGEVAPIPWFGTETVAEAVEALGRRGDRVGAAELEAVPANLGCVRFALACARAEADGPLAAEAGPGRRLPVAALLPAGRDALGRLEAGLAAGYLAFKWKVGVQRPEEEWGLLDDLLARLPRYATLRLDANGAWERRAAEGWLARCAERPVEFVEQPVAPAQVDLLLGLAADYRVTLALDEAVTGLAAAQAWWERGWRGVYVLKPALAGPLAEQAAWLRQTGADVVFSSAIETAVGRAAILRWVLANPFSKRALGFGVGELFGDVRWDGPVMGPLLEAGWAAGVKAEAAWNALP